MKILLEGVDGSGKDTQIALLKGKLDFAHFKYPTSSFPSIREYLEKKRTVAPKGLFLLFLADIANEQEKLAETPGLSVIDRYVMSTVAYDREFSYGQAKDIINDVGFIRPDITILLDLPPEEAYSRKMAQMKMNGGAPDRYDEDIEYLRYVRQRFLMLREDSFLCDKWVVLDATKSQEELHAEILELIKGQA